MRLSDISCLTLRKHIAAPGWSGHRMPEFAASASASRPSSSFLGTTSTTLLAATAATGISPPPSSMGRRLGMIDCKSAGSKTSGPVAPAAGWTCAGAFRDFLASAAVPIDIFQVDKTPSILSMSPEGRAPSIANSWKLISVRTCNSCDLRVFPRGPLTFVSLRIVRAHHMAVTTLPSWTISYAFETLSTSAPLMGIHDRPSLDSFARDIFARDSLAVMGSITFESVSMVCSVTHFRKSAGSFTWSMGSSPLLGCDLASASFKGANALVTASRADCTPLDVVYSWSVLSTESSRPSMMLFILFTIAAAREVSFTIRSRVAIMTSRSLKSMRPFAP